MVEVDCSSCDKPNPALMTLRLLGAAASGAVSFYGLLKSGNRKALAAWLACWGLVLTLCRYLICASCSGYGEMCHSFYLGKYTSMIFPRREKGVTRLGPDIEVAAFMGIFWIPALALRKERKERKILAAHVILSNLMLAGHFFHACRYCGLNADDEWKMICPAHRFWRRSR